jgi:hypothetical protein
LKTYRNISKSSYKLNTGINLFIYYNIILHILTAFFYYRIFMMEQNVGNNGNDLPIDEVGVS